VLLSLASLALARGLIIPPASQDNNGMVTAWLTSRFYVADPAGAGREAPARA